MITVAKNSGFCFGVSNAVNKTIEILKDNKNVYAIGEVVHNGNTIRKLENMGLITVENLESIPDKSIVIIRAHGVGPGIIQKAKTKELIIYDLTCPKVKKVHDLVDANKDNFIVIIGIKTHPEIIGTIGYANNYYVVEEEKDIYDLKNTLKDYKGKIYVFSQTTFSVTIFKTLVDLITQSIQNEIIVNSCICPSTDIRQEEVSNLSKCNDLVIVVGGKNSSNTEKLYKIARNNTDAIWVESKEEIDILAIKKYHNIAIVSGASTSKDSVDDINNMLVDNNVAF